MFTPYKKAVIQRAQRGEFCTLQERCLHCSRNTAASAGSDPRGDNEEGGSLRRSDSGETLSEGMGGRDVREGAAPKAGMLWPSAGPAMAPGSMSMPSILPALTSLTPVAVPDVPGLRVNIVPGLEGAKINIRPFDRDSSSSDEATDKISQRPRVGGSLFLGHIASYPSVHRLSHFIQESLPLGLLLVNTSRSVAKSTGRSILRPLHASPFSSKALQAGADRSHDDPALRRLLHLLDATAAHALGAIDHIVLVVLEAGATVRQWVVTSASQLRDLATYISRTYHREASKWKGASDVVVFFGAVGFTVGVGAFDALIFVAEWFFDGRAAREIEKREMATSF